jgi:hypothetical protein
MPSLGNRRHWAKNHTATTITKSNRSFIFILLLTGASRMPGNQMLRHLNRYNLPAGADFSVG